MSDSIIPSQRHLFSIPRDIAYFNCAYMSPQLRSATEAGRRGQDRKSRPWEIKARDFFTDAEQARSLFANIVACTADDVALTPSVSYGVEIAARNLNTAAGQRIVTLAEQFPSNVYPWMALAGRRDLQLDFVDKGEATWTQAVLQALDRPAAIVALPNVHWTDGALLDLKPIAARCRELGAALVLDLTQSLGVMSIDIEELDPDFVFCATYKWLLGPYGFAFLYAAPRWHDGEPIEHAWINREGSEDFAGLVNYRDQYQGGARRFEMGGRSQFAQLPVLIRALQQLLEWGQPNIECAIAVTSERITQGVEALGLTVPEPHAPNLLGVTLAPDAPENLLEMLAAEGIYVSRRGNSLRIAPHLYNDDEDVERLLASLSQHLPRGQ